MNCGIRPGRDRPKPLNEAITPKHGTTGFQSTLQKSRSVWYVLEHSSDPKR